MEKPWALLTKKLKLKQKQFINKRYIKFSKLYISIITLIVLTNNYIDSDSIAHKMKKENLAKDRLLMFNNSLNNIEEYMQRNNADFICSESNSAIKLLDQNRIRFEKLEPKYNWNEIRDLLNKLTKQVCRNNSH